MQHLLSLVACAGHLSTRSSCRSQSGAPEKRGAEVTLLDLRDLPLPLFDQDLEAEQGMPDNGTKLKTLFIDHHGLLIAAPEASLGEEIFNCHA